MHLNFNYLFKIFINCNFQPVIYKNYLCFFYFLFIIGNNNHVDYVRSLVSHIGCPAHKLAKNILEIINVENKFNDKYGIKNSFELTNNPKDFNIKERYKLASFDV